MKLKRLLVSLTIAGASIGAGPAVLAAPQAAGTSSGSAATSGATGASASAEHKWTTEQAVTSSVREAWALGGKTPEGFFEIVRALAEISAQKRGVAIPEDEQSGMRAGEWIKRQAKKDPDQLLYVIVDQAVQHSAKKSSR